MNGYGQDDRARHPVRASHFLVALAAAGLLAYACGDDNKDNGGEGTPPDAGAAFTPPDAATTQAPAPALTTQDQALQAMRVANAAEVQLGQLALTRAVHADVILLANRMVSEHTAANQRLDALVQLLGLQPAESLTSQELQAEANRQFQSLQATSSFDLAYVNSQIALHQAILSALDTAIIPNADDIRLKLELVNQRAEVENHLFVSQMLLAQLTGILPDGGVFVPTPRPPDGGTPPPPPADAGVVFPPPPPPADAGPAPTPDAGP